MISKEHEHTLLALQKFMIEQHYPNLRCGIVGRRLIGLGEFKSSKWRHTYKVKLEYGLGFEPKCTILAPEVIPSPDIHMYQDRSLCLYYPLDLPITFRMNLAFHTVPWLIKWILFYEIWLLNGKVWIGPEAPHGTVAVNRLP